MDDKEITTRVIGLELYDNEDYYSLALRLESGKSVFVHIDKGSTVEAIKNQFAWTFDYIERTIGDKEK